MQELLVVAQGGQKSPRFRSIAQHPEEPTHERCKDTIVATISLGGDTTLTFTRAPEEKKVKVTLCKKGKVFPLSSTTLDFIREAISEKRTPFVFHRRKVIIPCSPDVLELAWYL